MGGGIAGSIFNAQIPAVAIRDHPDAAGEGGPVSGEVGPNIGRVEREFATAC